MALDVSLYALFSVINWASIFLVNGMGKAFARVPIFLLSLRIKCHIEDCKCSFSKESNLDKHIKEVHGVAPSHAHSLFPYKA